MRARHPLLAILLGLSAALIAACEAEPELHVAEQQPPALPLTSAVAAGADGHLYVVEWREDAVIERFDRDGEPVEGWATDTPDLRCPFALASAGGPVYALSSDEASERQQHIHAVNLDGEVLASITDLDEGGLDLAVDSAGHLYVPLAEEAGIRIFDDEQQRFADWAPDALPFSRPVSVAIGPEDEVVVADLQLANDTDGDRASIVVLSTDGELIEQREVEDLPGRQIVYDVAVDADGRVLVAADSQILRAYSMGGDLLAEFELERPEGDPTSVPDCPALQVPPRIAAGDDGLIYWSPPWDQAMHPYSAVRAFEVNWRDG